jgi:hypothetical protein
MAKALLKGKGGISINVLQREYIMYTSKKPSKTCMVACSTHSSLKSATMGSNDFFRWILISIQMWFKKMIFILTVSRYYLDRSLMGNDIETVRSTGSDY